MSFLSDVRAGLAIALAGRKVKGAASVGPWAPAPWFPAPLGSRDWAAEAGDLHLNSAVMTCCHWILRTFPEAPACVFRPAQDGKGPAEIVGNHALTQLLALPNPAYTRALLWQGTILDYVLGGNAYWRIVRNVLGTRILELWWEPSYLCRPTWTDGSNVFIDHYQVWRKGGWIDLKPGEIAHIRFGLDPRNPRLGLSPLASALREVFSDNQAGVWTAQMLRNTGVPPLILSPKSGQDPIPDPAETKRALMHSTTGEHRGEPTVFEYPMDVQQLSFNPRDMDLSALRQLTEERIAGLIGLPPGVAGLGAGLAHATDNNAETAQEMAWRNCLIPMQETIAEQVTHQLIGDVPSQPGDALGWDRRRVKALQDDLNRKFTRLSVGYNSGWLTRAEVRQDAGFDVAPDGADDIYKPLPAPPAGAAPLSGVSIPVSDSGMKALPAPSGLPTLDTLTQGLEQEMATWLASQYLRSAHAVGTLNRNGHVPEG